MTLSIITLWSSFGLDLDSYQLSRSSSKHILENLFTDRKIPINSLSKLLTFSLFGPFKTNFRKNPIWNSRPSLSLESERSSVFFSTLSLALRSFVCLFVCTFVRSFVRSFVWLGTKKKLFPKKVFVSQSVSSLLAIRPRTWNYFLLQLSLGEIIWQQKSFLQKFFLCLFTSY
jgi:hypothetical protein